MATGGIFQLITNDGKQDRMLMASELLTTRLADAEAARTKNGLDPTPTLYDIERTHILFTNAHFKPFAAIGFEYNKVTTNSGNATLGGSITFSIPQFGDFFNDMIVHAILKQPTLSTEDGSRNKIDPSKQNLMRWCDYPGERLLKKVKFEVNGNPLDEYTRDAVNYHREFSIQPNKELAWKRCVGQEETQSGYIDQPNWENSGVAASDINYRAKLDGCAGLQTPTGQKTDLVELFIPLLFWCNKDPRLAVPSVAIPYGQRFITLDLASSGELFGEVARGFTTGTAYSEANIVAGGKFTDADGALKSIELYINNIFVNPDIHNIFIKRIGFTLIRVHRMQTHESAGGASGSTDSVLLQNLKWPIEAMMVGMRVSNYINTSAEKLRENLDKWYKFSTVKSETRKTQGWKASKVTVKTYASVLSLVPGVATATFSTLLGAAAASSPTLTLTSANPAVGVSGILSVGDVLSFDTLNGSSKVNVGPLTVGEISANGLTVTFVENVGSSALANYTHVAGVDVAAPASLSEMQNIVKTSSVSNELSYTVQVASPNITNISIKAHGIPIYNNFPGGFFNAYIPYNYGGHNLRAPGDCGAYLITFCLYPGTYQPSGHINISRAREFYIEYTTNKNINSGDTANAGPGTLVIVASAINFLLISDGSAVLRYST